MLPCVVFSNPRVEKMDPITLATTISTLTGVCLRTAGLLNNLKATYTHQQRTLVSMFTECTAISASLTQTQSCILKDSSPLDHAQLQEIFDVIITGCRVLFACLEQDIAKLSPEGSKPKSWKPWAVVKKPQTDWDQKKWRGTLADLRTQQGALILLNQLIAV